MTGFLMTSDSPKFLVALMRELVANINNWYGRDNYDSDRFGPYKVSFRDRMITRINGLLSGKIAVVPTSANEAVIQKIATIKDSLEGIAACYDLLADEYSKSILVKVLAYRLLGRNKVKLPL